MKVIARVGVVVLGGLLAASLHAQNWPLPAATPNTPVKCGNDCPSGYVGKLTPGWSEPIIGFTGRFLDSAYTQDWQQTFRTARAGKMLTNPAGTRIYFQLGNAVAAYDASKFFSRLESHEMLTNSTSAPVSPANVGTHPGGQYETYLQFDQFFYAENGSSWDCPTGDGQDRLFDYDVDDRGVVYMAYSKFSWGTAKDPGTSGAGLMQPNYQEPSGFDLSPKSIFWVKTTSGSYFVLVGNGGLGQSTIYNVDNYLHPVMRGTQDGVYAYARGGDGQTAIINVARQLMIYDNDVLIKGGKPSVNYAPANGGYNAVTFDGTSFWAAGGFATGRGLLSRFTPDASGRSYTRTDFDLSNSAISVRYRGGFLGMAVSTSIGAPDQRLYDISGGTPVEIPLNGVLFHYYSYPPDGFIKAPRSSAGYVEPWVRNGKLYLIIPAMGLGDVWQVRANGTIVQPPVTCGTLVPGTNVSATFHGPTSGCSSNGGTCVTTEPIAFDIAFTNGYDPSCATHAYTWKFDDGTQMSGSSVSKVLPAGKHAVECTVYNGTQSVTVSTSVTVDKPAPQKPTPCATMTANVSVFGSYIGPISQCHDGGTCAAGEAIAFSILYWQFAPTCATTYSWQFDDGLSTTGQSVTHTFTTGGPHTATCTVANGSQSLPIVLALNLSGNSSLPAPSVTLGAVYRGSGMYEFTPTVIAGTVTTFAWDFGDGSTQTTTNANPVQHTYTKTGPVMVTLLAGNGSASTLVTKSLQIDLGSGLHGDVNGDGVVNAADVFYLITNIFSGGAAPIGIADVNGDGVVNAADVFYLIAYVFAGGPAPK